MSNRSNLVDNILGGLAGAVMKALAWTGVIMAVVILAAKFGEPDITNPRELHQIDHSLPVWMTTPCEQEDSSDCYWDAGTSGNGEGQSFYSVRTEPGTVCIRYWDVPADNFCTDDPYPTQ